MKTLKTLDEVAIAIFGADGQGRAKKECNEKGYDIYSCYVSSKLKGTTVEIWVWDIVVRDDKTYKQMLKIAGKHGRHVISHECNYEGTAVHRTVDNMKDTKK